MAAARGPSRAALLVAAALTGVCAVPSRLSGRTPLHELLEPSPAPAGVFGPPAVPKPPKEIRNKKGAAAANCNVKAKQPIRVAIGFFGLFRNFSATEASVRDNLIFPFRQFSGGAPVDLFVHAMLTASDADSFRASSAEQAPLDQSDWLKLPSCEASASNQSLVDSTYNFAYYADREFEHISAAATKGGYKADTYLDIFRAKYSLWRVSVLIETYEQLAGFNYTHVVAARPDVGYPFFTTILPVGDAPGGGGAQIRVPNFGQFNGVNDRFAYGERAPMLYAQMAEFPSQFLQTVIAEGGYMFNKYRPNSEGVLCNTLRTAGVRVGVLPICVVRVLANGDVENYDFAENRESPVACLTEGNSAGGGYFDPSEPKNASLYVNYPKAEELVDGCGKNPARWFNASALYGWQPTWLSAGSKGKHVLKPSPSPKPAPLPGTSGGPIADADADADLLAPAANDADDARPRVLADARFQRDDAAVAAADGDAAKVAAQRAEGRSEEEREAERETDRRLAAADESTDAFFRNLFGSPSRADLAARAKAREERARAPPQEDDARWIDALFMR